MRLEKLWRLLRKADDDIEGVSFEDLWEPGEPGDVSDSIYTEETDDPDDEYAKVYETGEIDVGGNAPEVVKKGLAGSVAEAIKDLQDAAATLAEIGDGLDNVGKAMSCKACGGKVSMAQRQGYRRLMAQRGWTPESHKQFWSRISSSPDGKSPGGHRACVASMEGKTASPHEFCAWCEHEADGQWPDDGQKLEHAANRVSKAAASLAVQAGELRKAINKSR